MTQFTRIILLSAAASMLAAISMMFGESVRPQDKKDLSEASPDKTPPSADYNRQPKMPFNSSDFVFKFDQLEEAYRAPGEHTHRLDGEKYGFDELSFIITDTKPNGGPNLHVHEMEEAHVL